MFWHDERNLSAFRFYNGGILFASVTMVGIALISLYSFLLLVKAKQVVPGSYGGKCFKNV